jgi:hypothetical protein
MIWLEKFFSYDPIGCISLPWKSRNDRFSKYMVRIGQERKEMKKSSLSCAAGTVCILLTFLSFELTSINAPTLAFEEWLYIWMNADYRVLNPAFMFSSILLIVSAMLTAIFTALSFIFAFLEWKETKKR